ncbi:C2 domain-containing protein 5 isoform X1 [Ixodes scapularis]
MDTAEHCRLMLLLLRKFPEKVVEHGVKLIDTLQMAEKHGHCQTPLNQFRKLLVCDVAPLVLKLGVDLPIKQMYRLIHKCIEFYTVYIHAPNKAKLDLSMKLSPEAEAGSPEADLWRQLLSFVGLASHRLHWELADLVSEPGSAGVSDSQWQRLHSLVLSRPNPGVDYPGPQEAEEALASRQKQARTSSGSSSGGAARQFILRPALARESLEMLEYPFITMKQFPHGFIRSIGGVVSARSVKLLDQINNPDEPETRDAWWTELRKEIRSHTRSLSCNVVLGYIETTNICDEVAILSASGTAVLLNPVADRELSSGARHADKRAPDPGSGKVSADSVDEPLSKQDCKLCHIPYSEVSVPFQAQLIKCAMCRRSKVPDILFMTIEPPPGMPVTGKSCLIQARVCRNKKDLKGEQNAREISDSLPFLEFELHRQILSKLKLKNMNVIFGLKVQVSVGERVIAGIAS